MTSDILILLKEPASASDAGALRTAIYEVTKTAVVNFQPARAKVLLIKFDPETDVPVEMLDAVRATGRDAVLAGG